MSERAWHFYIDDMVGFAQNVISYCDGLDQATFEVTGLNYDATVRNLELIGEAATVLYDEMALVQEDVGSIDENRWVLVGLSNKAARLLTIVYTLRNDKIIRLISARKATKKEAGCYA